MEISQEMKDEARKLVSEGSNLPVCLDQLCNFYVANSDDPTVQAVTAITIGEKKYKIGFLK